MMLLEKTKDETWLQAALRVSPADIHEDIEALYKFFSTTSITTPRGMTAQDAATAALYELHDDMLPETVH